MNKDEPVSEKLLAAIKSAITEVSVMSRAQLEQELEKAKENGLLERAVNQDETEMEQD